MADSLALPSNITCGPTQGDLYSHQVQAEHLTSPRLRQGCCAAHRSHRSLAANTSESIRQPAAVQAERDTTRLWQQASFQAACARPDAGQPSCSQAVCPDAKCTARHTCPGTCTPSESALVGHEGRNLCNWTLKHEIVSLQIFKAGVRWRVRLPRGRLKIIMQHLYDKTVKLGMYCPPTKWVAACRFSRLWTMVRAGE